MEALRLEIAANENAKSRILGERLPRIIKKEIPDEKNK